MTLPFVVLLLITLAGPIDTDRERQREDEEFAIPISKDRRGKGLENMREI